MATDPSSASAADPYAVPRPKVEGAAPAAESETAYFPVSLLKLGVMCVATFSIYEIYWFYKNWKSAKGGRRFTAFSWAAAYVIGTAVKVDDPQKLKGLPGTYH